MEIYALLAVNVGLQISNLQIVDGDAGRVNTTNDLGNATLRLF